MGYLCAFREVPAKSKLPSGSALSYNDDEDKMTSTELPDYLQLQSAYNLSWYLGFYGRRKRLTRTREGSAISLPRPMFKSSSRRPRKFKPSKCDFLFSTGEFKKLDQRSQWKGLFDRVWSDASEIEEDKPQEKEISVITRGQQQHWLSRDAAVNGHSDITSDRLEVPESGVKEHSPSIHKVQSSSNSNAIIDGRSRIKDWRSKRNRISRRRRVWR